MQRYDVYLRKKLNPALAEIYVIESIMFGSLPSTTIYKHCCFWRNNHASPLSEKETVGGRRFPFGCHCQGEFGDDRCVFLVFLCAVQGFPQVCTTQCFHFRLLVSGHLQKEHDFFVNFVEGGRTVKEFCNQVDILLLWCFTDCVPAELSVCLSVSLSLSLSLSLSAAKRADIGFIAYF